MSQRHFMRRIAMELSTRTGLGGDDATPPTSVDATDQVVVQAEMDAPPFSSSGSKNNEQWQLPLLHNSTTMKNQGFTVLDVVRESVLLARARGTYFLGFLALFTLVYLLLHGFSYYLVYTNRPDHFDESKEACERNILRPWLKAAETGNWSSTGQEEFYTLFQQNCSMFQDPAAGSGIYFFKNGTVTLTPANFDLSLKPLIAPLVYNSVVDFFTWVWVVWAEVAVAWGLHVATRTTMSNPSRSPHRDPMHTPSQKLTEVFQEQFNSKVLSGTIRAVLTHILLTIGSAIMDAIILIGKSLVGSRFSSLPYLMGLPTLPNQLWKLANPLPFLFLLSGVAAALEPGMWGFRALWRGIRLARGNRLKSYAIFLMLFLLGWLNSYLISFITVKPAKLVTEPFLQVVGRSLGTVLLGTAAYVPELFVLPVLYFRCNSWREKTASMA